MIKTILVPTDFSKNATNALNYAVAFAKKEKAKLILLNAYHVTYLSIDVSVDFVAQKALYSEEAALESLKILRKKVEAEKVKCEIINIEGLAVDVVLKTIKSKKVDLVIMGTKGASGLKETFIGSNTAKVIEKAKCPIIAVPEKVKFQSIKQIVYTTDYHSNDVDTIKQLVELGKLFNSRITLLHVYSFKRDEEIEMKSMNEFKTKLKRKIRYTKIDYKLVFGDDLIKTIEKEVKKMSPELFAITTHQRNFVDKLFEVSITKKIAYHTKVPLLAFHYNKA